MKALFALCLLVSSSALAESSLELKTLVTCQQTDGDYWYEVGVVDHGSSRYTMVLLAHDTDNDRVLVIADGPADVQEDGQEISVQSRSKGKTFTLNVPGDDRGEFYFAIRGGKVLTESRMDCFRNNTISYPVNDGLEPRMSVGN